MNRDKRSRGGVSIKAGFFCCMACCMMQLLVVQSVMAKYEQPPTLKASSILQADIRKGKHHEVLEQVQNDGFLNHYRVKSPYGIFNADFTADLHLLVQEIQAIAAMKTVEVDETAMDSLKQSGANTVKGLKKLFNEPEETLTGAMSGVSSLFNRAKETIGRRETTAGEDSKASQLIGLSKSKGLVANRFGVNMYSANTVLQEELDRLAMADYLGGLGMGVATSVVPGVGGLILTTSNTARLLNESINTTPASKLWLDNKNTLLAMEMDEDTVELFLNNPAFSPAQATVLVAALESMQNVANRELYIKIALAASDRKMAQLITFTAVMTAGYHKNIAPLARVSSLGRIAKAEKKDGSIVLILPADHIIWSEKVDAIMNTLADKASKSGGKQTKMELWLLGDVSEKALTEMEEQGWSVHQRARDQLLPAKE